MLLEDPARFCQISPAVRADFNKLLVWVGKLADQATSCGVIVALLIVLLLLLLIQLDVQDGKVLIVALPSLLRCCLLHRDVADDVVGGRLPRLLHRLKLLLARWACHSPRSCRDLRVV